MADKNSRNNWKQALWKAANSGTFEAPVCETSTTEYFGKPRRDSESKNPDKPSRHHQGLSKEERQTTVLMVVEDSPKVEVAMKTEVPTVAPATTPAVTPAPQRELCLVCGQMSMDVKFLNGEKVRYLACKACHDRWLVAKNVTQIGYLEWVVVNIDLKGFEEELLKVNVERQDIALLRKSVLNRAKADGKMLSHSEIVSEIAKLKTDLYPKAKALHDRFEAARKFKAELEDELARRIMARAANKAAEKTTGQPAALAAEASPATNTALLVLTPEPAVP